RDRRKLRTGFLGEVIFRAAGEPLRREVAYLRALWLHEEATRLQTRVQAAPEGKVGAKLAAQSADAWKAAQERWARYAEEYRITPVGIEARLRLLVPQVNPNDPQGLPALMDMVFHDLRRSVVARQLEAETASQRGQTKEAGAALEALLQQAGTVASSAALQKLRQALDPAPAADALLFGDLAERGTFFWLRYRARLELAKLNP
ncbi:MAG: hypothetical protein L0Z62_39110, partial [Gemmataceae bacterium]|nr:hypothetical protein [Gemmataceae bacterium]